MPASMPVPLPSPSPAAPPAYLNAVGTAVPDHDIHTAFIAWARARTDSRSTKVFDRMASRSGIAHRWSVLPPTAAGGSPVDDAGFYATEPHPGTAARMTLYAEHAPDLAIRAIAALRATDLDWRPLRPRKGFTGWTDDYSTILPLLNGF